MFLSFFKKKNLSSPRDLSLVRSFQRRGTFFSDGQNGESHSVSAPSEIPMHGGGSDLAAGLNHVMRAPRGSECLSEEIDFTPKGRGGEEGETGSSRRIKQNKYKKARREKGNPSGLQVTARPRVEGAQWRGGGRIPPVGSSRSSSSGDLRPPPLKKNVAVPGIPTFQLNGQDRYSETRIREAEKRRKMDPDYPDP